MAAVGTGVRGESILSPLPQPCADPQKVSTQRWWGHRMGMGGLASGQLFPALSQPDIRRPFPTDHIQERL